MSFLTTERTEITEDFTGDLNILSGKILDCAIRVHKNLGPGLLESAYQHGLSHFFIKEGLFFEKEKMIPIKMDGVAIDAGYRADFIVENKIILETKAIEKIIPLHEAQILTYMKLGGFSLGLILNFNTQLMKDGIRRFKL